MWPVLVLLKGLLQRGRHVPLFGLTLRYADFIELQLIRYLGHARRKVAVKKVKLINDKLLR